MVGECRPARLNGVAEDILLMSKYVFTCMIDFLIFLFVLNRFCVVYLMNSLYFRRNLLLFLYSVLFSFFFE